MNQKLIMLSVAAVLVLGCKPKAPKSDDTSKTTGTASAGNTQGAAAGNLLGIPEKAVDLLVFEKRPSPTRLPAEFEAKDPMHILAWGDRNDDNLVFWEKSSKELPGVDGGPARVTTTLRTRYFMRSHLNDKWVSRRDEKTQVVNCTGDTTLDVITGDWSLTDVNDDGMGELTYAIRSGCRTDVSPLKHTVNLIERTQRYMLDGLSLVKDGDKELGGTIARDSFGKQPEFKKHAMTVWEATVRE